MRVARREKREVALLPTTRLAADDSEHEPERDVAEEEPHTQLERRELRLRDEPHGVEVSLRAQRVDEAAPAPVTRNEWAHDRREPIGQREHRAAERELEADEVDRHERRLLGRAQQAREAETHGGD